MSQEGWISVHRKIKECWIWDEKPFDRTHAWIDLLLSANHQAKKIMFDGTLYEVERGSFITSIRKLCDKWGWSNTKVKKFLEALTDEEMITYKSDTKKTTITIVNYEVYQDINITKNITETSQKHHRNVTETSQKHTNNNDNNDNNDNNSIYIEQNATVYKLWEKDVMKKPINFSIIKKINEAIEIHGIDNVTEAIYKTMDNGADSWGYVIKILQSVAKRGNDDGGNARSNQNHKQNMESAENKWKGFRPAEIKVDENLDFSDLI